MRMLANVMIGLGFLGGALVAVQEVANEVDWRLYLPALLLGGAGVVLVRRSGRHESSQVQRLHLDAHKLVGSLDRVVQKIVLLDGEKEALSPAEVPGRIDQLFRADLDAFAEARASLVHLHGLHTYAAVMSPFAAGERYLNRAWSAAVDGYVDEMRSCLGVARSQFEQARHELHQAHRLGQGPDPAVGQAPASS